MVGLPQLMQMLNQPRPTSPTIIPQGLPNAPDPYAAAVAQAKQRYPRIGHVPFALVKGSGPGMSETYEPEDEENPRPGSWTIQLRDPSVLNNPSKWANYIALESIHALQAQDPKYQQFTEQFINSMTPRQLKASQYAYNRDKKVFGVTEPFDKWLRRVQAQEYIPGGVFTDEIKNWIGPNGEGQYTPEQMKLLNQIQQYLQSSK